MRYVELTLLGSPASEPVSIIIPYNGDEFEFLATEWREIARVAAEKGEPVRADRMMARVFNR